MRRCVYETVGRKFKDIMKTVDPKLEHLPFEGKLYIFSDDKCSRLYDTVTLNHIHSINYITMYKQIIVSILKTSQMLRFEDEHAC